DLLRFPRRAPLLGEKSLRIGLCAQCLVLPGVLSLDASEQGEQYLSHLPASLDFVPPVAAVPRVTRTGILGVAATCTNHDETTRVKLHSRKYAHVNLTGASRTRHAALAAHLFAPRPAGLSGRLRRFVHAGGGVGRRNWRRAFPAWPAGPFRDICSSG